jgi:hypothetical protein
VVSANITTSSSENHSAQRMVISPLRYRGYNRGRQRQVGHRRYPATGRGSTASRGYHSYRVVPLARCAISKFHVSACGCRQSNALAVIGSGAEILGPVLRGPTLLAWQGQAAGGKRAVGAWREARAHEEVIACQ